MSTVAHEVGWEIEKRRGREEEMSSLREMKKNLEEGKKKAEEKDKQIEEEKKGTTQHYLY